MTNERYQELCDLALGRYLEKLDLDICAWLTDAEIEEFKTLSKE